MSAIAFVSVLLGASMALNVILILDIWAIMDDGVTMTPEQQIQQWIVDNVPYPHQSDSLPMDARVFWDIESSTVQDSHIITISDEDWKVKS